jgi:signal transduction histidine kinase
LIRQFVIYLDYSMNSSLQRYLNIALVSLFLIVTHVFYAQSNNSQQEIISEAGTIFDLAFDDAKTAKIRAQALVSKAIANNDEIAQAHALNSLGWGYFHLGSLDTALMNLEKSKLLFRNHKRDKEIIQVSLNLSEVYTRKNNYNSALRHLTEADELNKKTADFALQTDIYRQFGIAYRELTNFEKSSDYFEKAMIGFSQQKDHYRYVTTGLSLSILYRKMKKHPKSLVLLEELKIVHEGERLSDYLLAMIEENLGETYFETRQYQQALGHFREALKLFEHLNFSGDVAYEAINIGKTYNQLSQLKDAEKYLLRAKSISDSLNMLNYSLDASLEMAALYEKQGNWSGAYKYAQISRSLSDTLNIQEQIISTQELAEKYENDKKEQEIQLLQIQNELAESTRKKSRYALVLSTFLTFGALLIAWLLWNRIKLNKKLEFEKQQNKIAGDIEDERILNQFAVSLFGKNTIDDILWDVAHNCIDLLHFEDCVIYVADESRRVLIQYAAAGAKTHASPRQIFNPIEIPFGRGIVGTVHKNKKAEIVANTDLDDRYIIDDQQRLSEITVPIFINGKVYGIIDSEHQKANFYNDRHLKILERIAAICSERMVKLLTEEHLRHNIARDLHDEVGSTITSINILSNMLQKENAPKQKEHLQKISEQSSKIMENMSDIIWAINPNHDTIEQIVLKMKEFAIELIESAEIKCNFKTEIVGVKHNILPDERKFIYLIFKEAVNNAVKYSGSGEISIVVKMDDKQFYFSITDLGCGFDLNDRKIGNGITNMQERAKMIHGKLSIESAPNQGTGVHFSKSLSHDLGTEENQQKN